MKRFELFEYDKETQSLEELKIFDYLKRTSKKLVNKVKSLFKLKYGETKRVKLTIVIPNNLVEDKSTNMKKITGAQIEYFCAYHFGKKLADKGYQVIAKLDNTTLTSYENFMNEADKIQAILLGKSSDREKVRNQQKNREMGGIATAYTWMEAMEEQRKVDGLPPEAYVVTVQSIGALGTGNTKADFSIVMTNNKVSTTVIAENISHKLGYKGQAFGTQTSPAGMFYLLATGEYIGRGGKAKNEFMEEVAAKYIGNRAKGLFAKAGIYVSSPDARTGKLAGFSATAYKRTMKTFYEACAGVIHDGDLGLITSMGLEEDVDHFFVNRIGGAKRSAKTVMRTRTSKSSPEFKKLKDTLFGKNGMVKIQTEYSSEKCDIKFFVDGKEIYSTRIAHQEASGGKNVNVLGFGPDDVVGDDVERIYRWDELVSELESGDLDDIDMATVFDFIKPEAKKKPPKVKAVANIPPEQLAVFKDDPGDGELTLKAKSELLKVIQNQKLDVSDLTPRFLRNIVLDMNKTGKKGDINRARARLLLRRAGLPVKEEMESFFDFLS